LGFGNLSLTPAAQNREDSAKVRSRRVLAEHCPLIHGHDSSSAERKRAITDQWFIVAGFARISDVPFSFS
jgi:hypothetical protein